MRCKHVGIWALLLALCLPMVTQAETVTRSDLERNVAAGFFHQTPFQKVLKFVNADDAEGLRAYLLAHQSEITNNSLTGKVAGERTEHVYCQAALENKTNTGKVLIDFGYMPKLCGANYDYVEEINPGLACYALKTKQMGFMFGWPGLKYAADGGCAEEYFLYRQENLKFPDTYNRLTGELWLALNAVRPDLVSQPDAQRILLNRIASEEDSWFEREQMMRMVVPTVPVPPTYSRKEVAQFALEQVAEKNPTLFCQDAVSALKKSSGNSGFWNLVPVLDKLYKDFSWTYDGNVPAADRQCYNSLRQVLQQEDKMKAEEDARQAQEAQQAKETAWQAKLLDTFNGDKELAAKWDKILRPIYYSKVGSEETADFKSFYYGVNIVAKERDGDWYFKWQDSLPPATEKFSKKFIGTVVVGYTWTTKGYQVTVFNSQGKKEILPLTENDIRVTDVLDAHGFLLRSRTASFHYIRVGTADRYPIFDGYFPVAVVEKF